MSFWTKSNKTGTYTFEVQRNDANRNISKTYTIDSADTWEFKSITIDADTSGSGAVDDNGIGWVLKWWLDVGTNWNSGTLQTTWAAPVKANRVSSSQVSLGDSTSNEWYITGIQLEVGDKATPFEHRSFADELARCKRYYQRWDSTGSDATSNKPIGAGVWYSTTQVLAMFNYDEMRAAPTFSTDSTAFVKAYDGGASTLRTGGNGLDSIGTKAARFNFTVDVARTLGDGTMIQLDDTGSFLALDAEL